MLVIVIVYLAFGVWAAGYLIGWRNSLQRDADISDWLLLVTASVSLGPIMLAAVYFNGMMDKHPWTFYLRTHHGE